MSAEVDVSRQVFTTTNSDITMESKLLSIITGLKMKLQESREQLHQLQLQRIKLSNYTIDIEKQNQNLRKILNESKDFKKSLEYKKLSIFIVICLYFWSKQKQFNHLFVNKINQQKNEINTLKGLLEQQNDNKEIHKHNNTPLERVKELKLDLNFENNTKSQPIQITLEKTRSISPTSSVSSTNSMQINDSPPNIDLTPNLFFLNLNQMNEQSSSEDEDQQSDENDALDDRAQVMNIVSRLKDKLYHLQSIISNEENYDQNQNSLSNNENNVNDNTSKFNRLVQSLDGNREVFKRKNNNNHLNPLETKKEKQLPPLSPTKPAYMKHRRTNSRLIRALLDSENIYNNDENN